MARLTLRRCSTWRGSNWNSIGFQTLPASIVPISLGIAMLRLRFMLPPNTGKRYAASRCAVRLERSRIARFGAILRGAMPTAFSWARFFAWRLPAVRSTCSRPRGFATLITASVSVTALRSACQQICDDLFAADECQHVELLNRNRCETRNARSFFITTTVLQDDCEKRASRVFQLHE